MRGGVGTTTITAALAWSLQMLGENVLVVDACPDNLLRLSFNVDFTHRQGWARAMLDGQDWRDAGLRYTSQLDLLPFGQLSIEEQENPQHWQTRLSDICSGLQQLKASGRYQWILIDLPRDASLSIGISSLWDELRHMPAGGVWWFNVDRHEDAISLANQTIASQAETAHVAVISMDSDPAKIFQLDDSQGPEKIKLFSMLNHEKGLYYLTRDLQCSIDPHNYLFILVCANNAWQNIPAERLRSWLDKMNKWSRLNHCSLLVINPGNNNDKQFSLLLEEYRSLFGLASLRFQGDQHLLDIAFWCNEKGVSARQQLSVQQQNGIWTLVICTAGQ